MEARDALRTVTTVAGKAFALKAAAIAAVVFVVFLLVLGLFGAGIGGKAFADSCGKRGQPGDTGDAGPPGQGQNPGAQLRKDQIANAVIIDTVAKDGGLSGRATLIALITALQESTLLNLDHGDRDSVGLFQQRPSTGWGTKEQIMRPKYAAKMFLWGGDSGDPPGLTDIQGWQIMKLGAAAQAVQRSAFPSLYDAHEETAREIAREAGINLDRASTGGQDSSSSGGTGTGGQDDKGGQGDGSGECYPDGEGKPGTGKPGEPFHDGNAPWPAEVANPRSTAAAIAWARTEAQVGGREWYRACLAFVARTYGWSYSGVNYAIDHYKEMPPAYKHDLDRSPPPGALMYWDTGQRAGHVAIYLGGGKIASNDIFRPGYIDIADATDIETKWGATYLGWAPPYFPQGG
ncbi:peptidase M23 [Streptomyces sp. NPDC051546]|uniref:peptidase M23 n=1 Tax=Streptomyces sp. NPDC051546 TaxID=3365655 RepID=UPI00378DE1A3